MEVLAPASVPFDAIIEQESGGRAGVVGQRTPYGTPLGMAQMLPETAREMAGKLKLPWRPELLTAATPEGADYQKRLGEAYFNEGLARTGNLRDAARYYHGGPNRKLWGPKTNRYADSFMRRIGS